MSDLDIYIIKDTLAMILRQITQINADVKLLNEKIDYIMDDLDIEMI